MRDVVIVMLLMFPSVLFAVVMWGAPRLFMGVLLAGCVALPLGGAVWLPAQEKVVVTRTSVLDPGGRWSRAECRGRGGVLLLMKDARRESPVRWWVKCRDGSKSGIVTDRERPYVPSRRFDGWLDEA